MRFGNWRGVTLALGLAIGFFASSESFAGGLHLIKGEVDAIDYNTGSQYFAPPIPYGHYAKDKLGHVGKTVGGMTHGIFGKFRGLGSGCGACGGAGCSACGGGGGIFNHGSGCASGDCGTSSGCGLGSGCGLAKSCGLSGLFSHKEKSCGVCGIGHSTTVIASSQGMPSMQGPGPIVSAQGYVMDPGSPCGAKSCGIFGKHGHGFGQGGIGSGCGSCGGSGCGKCRLGNGGLGLGGCRACGGAGCGLCSKAKGLAAGLVGKLFHKGDIKWFVGPGGPVPLTPGYVPYVISTRSPRDFFAFAPFNPDAE